MAPFYGIPPAIKLIGGVKLNNLTSHFPLPLHPPFLLQSQPACRYKTGMVPLLIKNLSLSVSGALSLITFVLFRARLEELRRRHGQ